MFPRGNADFAGSRLRIKEIGSQAPASETEAGEGLDVREKQEREIEELRTVTSKSARLKS